MFFHRLLVSTFTVCVSYVACIDRNSFIVAFSSFFLYLIMILYALYLFPVGVIFFKMVIFSFAQVIITFFISNSLFSQIIFLYIHHIFPLQMIFPGCFPTLIILILFYLVNSFKYLQYKITNF